MNYAVVVGGVERLPEKVFIPYNPQSRDWQTYQNWLAAGGVPMPLKPGPQYEWNGTAWVVNPVVQDQMDLVQELSLDLGEVRKVPGLKAFLQMTPTEIDAYIDANVAGTQAQQVAAIKNILGFLAKVISVTARNVIN